MSCMQANVCNVRLVYSAPKYNRYAPSLSFSVLRPSSLSFSATRKYQHCKGSPRLVYSAPKYNRYAPICLFGGKGDSETETEAFPWELLKKTMGGLRKEPSVQDLLRERMQELEFGGDGGARNPPGDDGGDGSGGSEDEGFADELLQVILATIGFIFVYIYMIRGEEMTRLAKDYIKYLFGALPSVRLRRAMYKWGRFYQSITRKKVVRKDWLERAIVATPTWWHKPRRLVRMMRSFE